LKAFAKMAAPVIMIAGLIFTLTPGSASAAGSYKGCPYGAVCVYNGSTASSGIESGGTYWSYGPHNLSNQFGNHLVVNNQYGGAWAEGCTGYNGTGKGDWVILAAPYGWVRNLTPINSIALGTGNNYPCPPP
jgi:hypothetical protein